MNWVVRQRWDICCALSRWQWSGLLFRRILVSWRKGLAGTAWNQTQLGAESCTWDGITCTPMHQYGLGLTSWNTALEQRPWESWWTTKWPSVGSGSLHWARPAASWAVLTWLQPADQLMWHFIPVTHLWNQFCSTASHFGLTSEMLKGLEHKLYEEKLRRLALNKSSF